MFKILPTFTVNNVLSSSIDVLAVKNIVLYMFAQFWGGAGEINRNMKEKKRGRRKTSTKPVRSM
jgi:hypothetical protein